MASLLNGAWCSERYDYRFRRNASHDLGATLLGKLDRCRLFRTTHAVPH